MKWTAEMYRALGAGLDSGLSAGLIAKQIGVSRNAVIGQCFRLKVNPGERRKPTTTEKRGPLPRCEVYVKLKGEIFRFVSDYARQQHKSVDTIVNAALRDWFGAA